jgi:hypothetical protein
MMMMARKWICLVVQPCWVVSFPFAREESEPSSSSFLEMRARSKDYGLF